MAELGPYCEGCGAEKQYRGRQAEAFVACGNCWRRLPRWLREAFMADNTRPAGGAPLGPTVWELRLRKCLRWLREAG